jgi:hypothetical protein
MYRLDTGGLRGGDDCPCLGHLFLKPGHVSYVSGGMLRESKWRGVLGNLKGTRETQINFFLSLN